MEKKTAPESKILPPDGSKNQKKNKPKSSALEQGGALLKKNEFTMILLAALVVTVLVFFFFFRGSSTQQEEEKKPVPAGGTEQVAPGFENRISALEISLAKLASSSDPNKEHAPSRAMSDLDERITRVETAINLKLDTLIERVDKLESRLNTFTAVAPAATPKPKSEVKKPAASTPVPEKKVRVTKKKTEKPNEKLNEKLKKTNQFHTVQKGETLWSISQKYNTTVAAIRKLNNLTPEDKIYPGSNLLVRSR